MNNFDKALLPLQMHVASYIGLLKACTYQFSNRIGRCKQPGCTERCMCRDCRRERELSKQITECIGDDA